MRQGYEENLKTCGHIVVGAAIFCADSCLNVAITLLVFIFWWFQGNHWMLLIYYLQLFLALCILTALITFGAANWIFWPLSTFECMRSQHNTSLCFPATQHCLWEGLTFLYSVEVSTTIIVRAGPQWRMLRLQNIWVNLEMSLSPLTCGVTVRRKITRLALWRINSMSR